MRREIDGGTRRTQEGRLNLADGAELRDRGGVRSLPLAHFTDGRAPHPFSSRRFSVHVLPACRLQSEPRMERACPSGCWSSARSSFSRPVPAVAQLPLRARRGAGRVHGRRRCENGRLRVRCNFAALISSCVIAKSTAKYNRHQTPKFPHQLLISGHWEILLGAHSLPSKGGRAPGLRRGTGRTGTDGVRKTGKHHIG
jgi:hypothetical protein